MLIKIESVKKHPLAGFSKKDLSFTEMKKERSMTLTQGKEIPGYLIKVKPTLSVKTELIWVDENYALENGLTEDATKGKIKKSTFGGNRIQEIVEIPITGLSRKDLLHVKDKTERERSVTKGLTFPGLRLRVGSKLERKNFIWMATDLFEKLKINEGDKIYFEGNAEKQKAA